MRLWDGMTREVIIVVAVAGLSRFPSFQDAQLRLEICSVWALKGASAKPNYSYPLLSSRSLLFRVFHSCVCATCYCFSNSFSMDGPRVSATSPNAKLVESLPVSTFASSAGKSMSRYATSDITLQRIYFKC